jgi:putative GTP pyrophosphokinase
MAIPFPDRNELRKTFEKYAEGRERVARKLERRIEKKLRQLSSHLTVRVRVKDFSSYFRKYIKVLQNSHGNGGLAGGSTEGALAAPVITDLIGIRIICPFIGDLRTVEDLIKKHFDVFEVERKGANHTFREFGYQSIHLLITIPPDIIAEEEIGCTVAEIQIRTILQDAWAEVEHELVYKAEFNPFGEPLKRKLAALNASLSLADIIFQEIKVYQSQLNAELGKRRGSFFKKIEESTDALLFDDYRTIAPLFRETSGPSSAGSTIDDLLLDALYAHNNHQFPQAVSFYTRILEMNPEGSVAALIYKHRGMAYFAQSQYRDAGEDFSRSLDLDPGSYKAAYYRGIVKAVQSQYAGAIDDFTLSQNINPYQPFCLYRRGQAYFHLEDYPQALADCEAALALDPDAESIRKFRALLLEKLRM